MREIIHLKGPDEYWGPNGFWMIQGKVRIFLDGSKKNKAEAYLIAAAPDLLEACKKALTFFVCERDFQDIKDSLENAIKNAEQGSQNVTISND